MTLDNQTALEASIAHHLAQGGVRDATTAAIRGYGPQIYGYLMAVLRDEESASEVFCQFSEELWRSIGGFRGASSFRTWAYRLASRAAMHFVHDPYRRRGRRLRTSEESRS